MRGFWLKVMTLFFGGILSLNLTPNVFAQEMGYEWLDPGQEYIKIRVARTGIYRLTRAALNIQATVRPTNLHIYYRGKEIPIYVADLQRDNLFNHNDYIEFFGQRNDGTVDALLYRDPDTGLLDPSQQPNPDYSLYTDTSAYFLTWNSQPRAEEFTYKDFTGDQFGQLTPQPHFRHTVSMNFVSEYTQGPGGVIDWRYVSNSDFITGEGYVGPAFSTQQIVKLATKYKAPNANNPALLQARFTGISKTPTHKMNIQFGNVSQSVVYAYFKVENATLTGTNNDVGDPETTITFTPQGTTPDVNRLTRVSLTYDRQFKFDGEKQFAMGWRDAANSDALMEFNGMGFATQDSGFVYDLTNKRRIRGVLVNGKLRVTIPKSGKDLNLWATTGSAIAENSNNQMTIKPQYFEFLFKADGGAEFVIITHRGLAASALKYAQYRANNPYNRLSTKIVYTDQIYDEFGYGMPTVLAIQRFCNTAANNWAAKPKYFFLWGKGWLLNRNTAQNSVPTWGLPACDNEFVSNIIPQKSNIVPHTPIGRVNVLNNNEGEIYLEKIKQYEATPYQPWMKQAVHLGGGASFSEQLQIQSFFNTLGPIYKGPKLGGKVHYYQKNSNQVISEVEDATIKELISGGVGIITFMGHSSANVFDVAINQPYEYDNFGKYPFILANGCYSGDFTNNLETFGERFLKEPKRGAIGYISSSSTGYVHLLSHYSQRFYELAFRDSIGKGIGDVVKYTVRNYVSMSPSDQGYINHAKHNNLQCDPSLKLYHPSLPDLMVNERSLYFEPAEFTAEAESLTVNIVIHNQGLAVQDTYLVSLKQTVQATGQIIDYGTFKMPAIMSIDTLSIRIKNPGTSVGGLNLFEVWVDSDEKIEEIYETNNRITITKYFDTYRPAVLYPWRFAVINKKEISLKASAFGIQTTGQVAYIFEIDTSYKFNSPLKQNSGTVMGTVQEGSWQLPWELQDSTVYYWRVRLANAPGIFWTETSFQYINGEYEGWAQARAPQFLQHIPNRAALNPNFLQWEFEPTRMELLIRAGYGDNNGFSLGGGAFGSADNNINNISPCVLYCVIDGNTLRPLTYEPNLKNMDVGWGPTLAGQWRSIDKLVGVINQMRMGDYFAAMGRAPNVQNWPIEAFEAFTQLGVTYNLKQAGDFFVLLGRKGAPYGSALEVYAPNSGGTYMLNTALFASRPTGQSLSETVGPANGWLKLIWDWKQQLNDGADNVTADLIGIKGDGSTQTLLSNLKPGNYDLQHISATEFPQLRLQANFSDTLNRSCPQLDNWYILYAPAPEAAINPSLDYEFRKDTVSEGENIYLRLAMENISELDMQNMIVRYQLRQPDRSLVLLAQDTLAPLPANAVLSFERTFSTHQLAGLNTLIVTINPEFAQPERYLFNNVFYQNFYVLPDIYNPILDVTFDGQRIQDRDYVRPTPKIVIHLNDENRYLPLNDTSCITVYLKPADQLEPAPPISYTAGQLSFVPAKLPDNKAQAIFLPKRLEEGEYILEAQGFDRKRNPAGNFRYSIRFQVKDESTMSDVLPFPNPTQGFTRFMYSLTGPELPTTFKIHIYTINGKRIKSIDVMQEGTVAVGRDVVAYTWDGTDEFGSHLADGVYLYRVEVETPPTRNFRKTNEFNRPLLRNGWGKLVLVR